jgi:hypothetical protein
MKKESIFERLDNGGCQGFCQKKYYPHGWRLFLKNPKGLTLQSDRGKPYLAFLFLFWSNMINTNGVIIIVKSK